MNGTATRWLCAFAVLVFSLVQTRGQYDPEWTRNFRAGVMAGFNIKATFKTGGNLTLSGNNPGPTNTHAANHFFDNGYVRVDDFNNSQNYTTFWGYQDASQYDAVNSRLLYQGGSAFSANGTSTASGNSNPGDVGFEVAYGGYPWRWEHLRLGFDFGFGYLPINISGRESLSGNVTHNTYGFQVPDGVVVPGAPYNGGRSGFGQPSILDEMSFLGSSVTNGLLTGKQTLEATLYTFRLGPALFFDLNQYLGLTVSAGPAVGFVTGNLKFDETITPADGAETISHGEIRSTEFVYGGYVSAMLTYHATQNGDVFIGVQYMPLSQATFGGGGRSARLDLKGAVYISGGINWPF